MKAIIGCAFFLLCIYHATAMPNLSFKKIEGTISNVIYCVYQDSKGYIWIGTEGGVSRYDGYSFKHFTKDGGLTDNDVFQIKEDRKGRLWFLTYTGEPTIYDHGKILTPNNCAFLKDIRPGSIATGFVEKQDTIVYVTYKKIYVLKNDKLISVITSTSIKNVSERRFFLNGYIRDNKIFYVSNTGIYSLVNKQFTPFTTDRAVFDAVATKMFVKNNMLVLISGHAVSIYNIQKNAFVKYELLPQINLIDVAETKNPDVIWVLTNKGIYDLSLSKGTFTGNDAFHFPALSSIIYDNEGNVWAGSINQGLFFSPNNNVVQYPYQTATQTIAAYSLAIYKDHVIAGYTNSEFTICNKNIPGDKKYKIPMLPTYAKVYGFSPGAKGIWVATGNVLVEYDMNLKKNREIVATSKTTTEDGYNNLYVAHSVNVAKIDLNKTYKKRIEGKELERVSSLYYDGRVNSILCRGKDTVLLGALNGIHLIVKDKEVKGVFSEQRPFHTSVTKIINTPNGILFTTSGEGVVLLAKDSTYVLNKSNGLQSNNCNSAYAVGDTLWIATTSGLSRTILIRKDNKFQFSFKNYTEANGLPSNKINDVIVFRDTVWAATENGVCYFNKNERENTFPSPNVIIEQVLANGKNIAFEKPFKLAHDTNNIQIRFTGISFYSKGMLQYKYKLDGTDDDWHYTSLREVQYPSLAPGKYKFLLMASNASGLWNNTPLEINFEIIPPYWKTWWFWSLIILVVVAIIYLFIRYRFLEQKKNLSLINKALQLQKENAEYEKQLVELEQQALRIQMNPHFIFNAITAAQGLYAAGKTIEAKEYLRRFSRMLRAIFEVSGMTIIPLAKELELITDYIELSISKLNYHIHYTIDCRVDKDLIAISPLVLQPLVENALVHGLFPLKKGGNLDISIHIEGDKVVYTIQDNGKGVQLPLANKNKPTGLSVTRQRIALLNKTERNQDVFKIENLGKDNRHISGTKITFTTSIIYIND